MCKRIGSLIASTYVNTTVAHVYTCHYRTPELSLIITDTLRQMIRVFSIQTASGFFILSFFSPYRGYWLGF